MMCVLGRWGSRALYFSIPCAGEEDGRLGAAGYGCAGGVQRRGPGLPGLFHRGGGDQQGLRIHGRHRQRQQRKCLGAAPGGQA